MEPVDTIDEVRQDMLAQYMKQDPTPGNCLVKDHLLAMINYAEKVDGESELDRAGTMARGIDHLIHASVNALINYIYRVNGVCTNCNPEAAIVLTNYMKKQFTKDLMDQSLGMATLQVGECDAKKNKRQGNVQKANAARSAGEAVQRSKDTE